MMTNAERAAFEMWFTEFRSEFHDIRKAGSSPYTVSLRAWMTAIEYATAAEREARPDETIIEHRLRTDPEYCQLFIKEASKLAVEAEREACAELCLQIWRKASNTRPEYRQNEISHGCLACNAAIRARGGDQPAKGGK